jgi:acyl dehydratase
MIMNSTPRPPRVCPASTADLKELLGRRIGPTEWFEITQAKIDAFADLTEDRQWIHVDPKRAAASEFGSTIGHGLFTLALGPKMMYELMSFDSFAHSLNYGYQKVRFPSPLPVDSRIRMYMTVSDVEELDVGAKFTVTQEFEREDQEKPVCVAEAVSWLVDGA